MKGKVFPVAAVAAAIALAILGLALMKDDTVAQNWQTPEPRTDSTPYPQGK